MEKAKLKTQYREEVGRRRAEAQGQRGRDEKERERHGEALRRYELKGKKGGLRSKETIKVYAGSDLRVC